MGRKFIIFGSWKVRHNEPVHKDDKHLVWVELKEHLTENTQKFTMDNLLGLNYVQAQSTPFDEDWMLANIPLGVVFEEGNCFRISYGTLQIEALRTTFMKLDVPLIALSREQLFDVLYQLYEEQHLYLNNHECFYIRSEVTFTKQYSTTNILTGMDEAYQLGEAFEMERLPGFRLKMTDSWHRYNYDQYTFKAEVSRKTHYVTEVHRAKKKEWNAPFYEYLQLFLLEQGTTKHEQSFKSIRNTTTPSLTMLKDRFGYSFEEYPGSRNSIHGIHVESEFGNIFSIQFSTIQVHESTSAEGRFQSIEVRYHTTSGRPDELIIEKDFIKLVQEVELYFANRCSNLIEINIELHDFLEMYLEGSSKEDAV